MRTVDVCAIIRRSEVDSSKGKIGDIQQREVINVNITFLCMSLDQLVLFDKLQLAANVPAYLVEHLQISFVCQLNYED